MLLNVGPMGDGRIDPADLRHPRRHRRLDEAQPARRSPAPTRTPLPVQAWGESTRQGNTLYLHVLSPAARAAGWWWAA